MGNLFTSAPVEDKRLTHKTSTDNTTNYLSQNILICGPARNGKTVLTKYIYNQIADKIDKIYVYGNSSQYNEDKFLKDVDINSIDFNDGSQMLFIFEDINTASITKQSGFMQALYNNNCTVIFTCQYPSFPLTSNARSQFTLKYFANNKIAINRKRIYDDYTNHYNSYNEFTKDFEQAINQGDFYRFFVLDSTLVRTLPTVYSFEVSKCHLL